MSRLSIFEKGQLTPELRKHAERTEASGQATMFQVLGHCPEMFEEVPKPAVQGGIEAAIVRTSTTLRPASAAA